jgi:hypothetical protein
MCLSNRVKELRMRKLIVTIMLLTASICNAGEVVGAWEISMGADYVQTFQMEYIPDSSFYPTFAVRGRPDEIIVFPGRLDVPLESNTPWQPQGLPLGIYVFVLNIKSGEVSLLTLDWFLKQEIVKENFQRKFCSKFPELSYKGEDTGYAVVNQRKGRKYIVAASCNSTTKKKTTFGIPSPMPFMGRQKFFETRTYYSGTVFLEVFEKERPLRPIVQFKQNFRNLGVVPVYGTTAEWVQGAETPLLIFVENGIPEKGKKGKIFLISCPF